MSVFIHVSNSTAKKNKIIYLVS